MCGGDLADGVADEDVGGEPVVFEGPVQRGLQGEERGLRVLGPVQEFRVLAPHHFVQRPVEDRVETVAHLAEGGGEDRVGFVQFASHAEALAALAGEEERRSAGGHGACGQAGGLGAVGECREAGEEGGAVGGVHHGAVVEAGTGGKRGRDLRKRRIGVPGGVRVQSSCLVAQCLFALRRQQPGERGGCGLLGAGSAVRFSRPGRLLRFVVPGLGGLIQRLLDDDVRVGAADPERRHGGTQRQLTVGGPRLFLGEQPHRAVRPVDMVRGPVDVERARQHSVPDRHHHLDDASDPGRGLGVTDVGLQRP